LAEVEVVGEVAEDFRVFADVGSWVGSPVGLRVDTRTVEKVVFDEFEVGVEAEGPVWRRG